MTVVCKFDELESGTAKRFDVDGKPVAVVRIDDEVFAIGDICSHANVSLSDGEVWCETKQLECPRHSSAFSLVTGVPETLPATQPVPVYVARVIDGNVDVEVGS
jgi:3-phenylpropionate/trans-cinnamate dioxygenase ferredoxin subunit